MDLSKDSSNNTVEITTAEGLNLNVVLCWHMHQPYYREGLNGKYHLPWVYLHGIKDYTDMAAHLENHPDMRAVVNFSPILLEQLDAYVKELHTVLHRERSLSSTISDPILALLCGVEEIPESIEARKQIVEDCKRCYAPRLIDPYPAFKRLIDCMDDAFEKVDAESPMDTTHFPLSYLQDQYFIDLLMWYHLAWLGHSIKQTEVAQRLIEKGHGFTLDDRCQLVSLISDSLAGIIPRYKKLADDGQIELSLTPYAHPIIPLLNDFENMRCSLPHAPAPQTENYPGGWARSRWHMKKGLEVFQHYFGRKPEGVWLSEGGVSPDALQLLDEYDIKWTATGEAVWQNTCNMTDCSQGQDNKRRSFFKPYQYNDKTSKIYFRDDGLSDLIGFEYSHWNADDAARNFEENLENIATFLGSNDEDNHVVSVILDGENAWEYYLDNGYHFLDSLYRKLSSNNHFKMTTFAEVSAKIDAVKIDQLCSGSWVYGSFSTWIGQEDKNRAWEYLVEVKKIYDQKISGLSKEKQKEAELQLAICEGSDWFWWFGEYNSSESVNDFDRLFRVQLKLMYNMLGVTPPEVLNHAISVGGGNSENSGTMRRNT